MTDIATQIRARLDAIAAERVSLDDEERRLKKALEALEPATAAQEPTTQPLTPPLDEVLRRLVYPTPMLPAYPFPCPAPHYPFQPLDQWDVWRIPLGLQVGDVPWTPGDIICGTASLATDTSAIYAYGHSQD